MVKVYDIAVKKLIEVFANKIPVYGLQNDDTSEQSESVITQAGLESTEDKVSFPMISVFRNPEITITDGSSTKRSSSSEGYSWQSGDGKALSLVTMRSTLSYTIDVFDVTKASAEEIATKLFFRLRNNPQVEAVFNFSDLGYSETCVADLFLDDKISHIRTNDKSKAQAYKIRFSFQLLNVNLYDILVRDFPELSYSITVKLNQN